MTDKEKITEILKAYTKKHNISASSVILEEYAKELVKQGATMPIKCKDCKDYSPVMFNGEPMHYGYCCNTHDSVLGNRHRYEGDFCSYGELKEREGK